MAFLKFVPPAKSARRARPSRASGYRLGEDAAREAARLAELHGVQQAVVIERALEIGLDVLRRSRQPFPADGA